jgi:hypothetical protein
MEAMLFAIQLRTLLRDDVGWQGGSIFRDSRLAAIGVHVAFNVSSEVGAANASHINALLNQAGFMSMLAYGEPDHDGLPTVWDDSIEIRVGAKPLPYMPELGDLCPRPCQ